MKQGTFSCCGAIVLLLLLVSFSSKAQSFSTSVGGANGLMPSINYEQSFFGDYGTDDAGIRLSVGLAYWPGYQELNMGFAGVWGKRKNWELGLDHSRPFRLDGESYSIASYSFFYFGFRFGPGRVRGLAAVGPVFSQPAPSSRATGGIEGIKLKTGLSVRVFRTGAQRRAKREEKRKSKNRFN